MSKRSRRKAETPEPRADARPRTRLAAAIALLYLALSCFNLFYPSPKGPADNGDFARVFASFSTGPLGLEFWPSPSDTAKYQMRFFNYYHRFWRLDGYVPDRAWKTSSALVFLPARLVHPVSEHFDLAFNSFVLLVLLSAVVFATLRSVESAAPFAALSAAVLLMSDSRIVAYLNSFFMEAGAYVYFLLLLCFLFRYWQEGRMRDYAAALACGVLLSTTRVAYAAAAFPALTPVLFGSLRARKPRALAWKIFLPSAALLLAAGALFLPSTPPITQRDFAYHFIFGGALPRLPEAQRPAYLNSVGIDSRFASLSGKDAYQSDSQINDPELSPRLTNKTQTRAITALLQSHPGAFFGLLRWGFSTAGFYPEQDKPGMLSKFDPPASISWSGWSLFRNKVLHGAWSYGVALLLLAAAGVAARRSGTGSWPAFFLLCGIGFLIASAGEVVISVLGNGPFDIWRHNYLANLLLDGELIFSTAAIASIGKIRPPAQTEPS